MHYNKENYCAGDIMIVGHAGSLDSLSRQIQGLSPRAMPDFVSIVTKVRGAKNLAFATDHILLK